MAEVGAMLGQQLQVGRFGAASAAGDVAVRLGVLPAGGLWQVSGWAGFEASVAPLLSALGVGSLPGYGAVTMGTAGVSVMRLAPARIWLGGPDEAALTGTITNMGVADWAAVDLSHARVGIALEGAGVEDLMARLVTIDCDGQVFEPGHCATTALHEVSVVVVRRAAGRFEILVPVTWVRSLWSYVCEAAAPLGYEVVAIS